MVDTAGDHCPVAVAILDQTVVFPSCDVVQTGFLFQCLRADDAAHVAVAVNGPAVLRVGNFAQNNAVRHLRGVVRQDILMHLRSREQIHRLHGGAGKGVQIVRDFFHVPHELFVVFVDLFADPSEFTGNTGDRRCQGRPDRGKRRRIRNVQRCNGAAHRVEVSGQSCKTAYQFACVLPGVLGRVLNGAVQRRHAIAQPCDEVFCLADLHHGFCPAHDAAHIPASVDLGTVAAAVYAAAAAPGDASHVVAHMQIAYDAAVAAALRKAAVIPCDAADIRDDIRCVGGKASIEIYKAAGIDLIQAKCRIHHLRVYITPVLANEKRSLVQARHTADHADPLHGAGGRTAGQKPAGLVFPNDPADLAPTDDTAAEAAVRDRSAIAAYQAAYHIVAVSGRNRAADVQVTNIRVLSGFQEQAAGGLGRREIQVIDRMTGTVKNAVKNRDRGKVASRKGDIVVQHHAHIVRPCVQRAV